MSTQKINQENFPRIGVGVIVIKDGKILLGKRKSKHGESTWGFPGGHLEFGEEIEDCAIREVKEETGLIIKNMKKAHFFTNDFFKESNKHYVTLYVIADYESGELEILEPDKCEEWNWFKWNQLPQPLFLPIQNLIKQNVDLFF